jgi:predicted LPLAT superfamily acyltransferase
MSESWQHRPEGGTALALRLICNFALRFGRRPARLALYPITAYFLTRRTPERRASRVYLERILRRPVTLRDVARHMHCFAGTILDRVFLLSERYKRFDIRMFGLEVFARALRAGRGVLLFGSHLGSFDAIRVLSEEWPETPVRVVFDLEQSPALTGLLQRLNPRLAATMINARSAGPATILAIKETLDRNGIVAMLADRVRPGEPYVLAEFLGRPAAFPMAPWLLATALGAPVALAFGLYHGQNRYDLHFETFTERLAEERIGRSQRRAVATACAQRFAERLAAYAQLAPYNWFNFYDFWQETTPSAPSAETGSAAAHPDSGLVRRS